MIHPDHIFQAVCHAFGVEPEDVWGPSRNRMLSEPRKITAYLLRKLTEMKLVDITLYLNRTDHTTCLYWLRTVEEKLKGEIYRKLVSKIEEDLVNDQEKLGKTPDLCSRHPVLRGGPRHSCDWHRLQRILQCMPGQNVPVSRAGSAESGRPVEVNN
jgi:hypothetical protein